MKLMTVSEVAKFLDRSEAWVRNKKARGQMDYVAKGSRVYFDARMVKILKKVLRASS